MKLLAKFNLILLLIFGTGGVLISLLAYSFLIGNARREVLALLYLVLTLAIAVMALDTGIYWLVIRPLSAVSTTADRVSKGERNVPPLVVSGNDEIAAVTTSFNRMQVSLAKALALLNDK